MFYTLLSVTLVMEHMKSTDTSKHAHHNLGLIIKIVVGSLMIVGPLAYLFLILGDFSFEGKEHRNNTPVVDISQLTWESGPYRLYYRTEQGIFSVMSDGTDKEMIFPRYATHVLLDTSKQVLIEDDRSFFLLDKDGQNSRTVFEKPPDRNIGDWIESPDESKLAIRLTDKSKVEDIVNRSPDKLAIVNLKTMKAVSVDAADLESAKDLHQISWSQDSALVYLAVTTFATTPGGREVYFSVDPTSGRVTKLGEEAAFLSEQEKQGLRHFVRTSPPVVSKGSESGYEIDSATSPDGTQTVHIDFNGNINVNNQHIIFWSYDGFKGPEYCRFPRWLPDNNHIVIDCNGTRIIEVDSKRVAILDTEGYSAQWFQK